MEQNIADLLKDAFSEIDIDFNHLQSDEETNTSQTQLVMDEDMGDVNDASKLWTSSEQASVETFSNAYEQEEREASSDYSESELSNSITSNTESHEIDNDQFINTMMTEVQQPNYTAGEFIAEEGNMQSDHASAGVSTQGVLTGFSVMEDEKNLTEEEHMEILNIENQPQASLSKCYESQTPEETSSESEEELSEKYSTKEQFSKFESAGKVDSPFVAKSANIAEKLYDMKEFTEEDQEQIEESLADYPSDFSHSENEEPGENATAQMFTVKDITSTDAHSNNRMEDLPSVENVDLQNKDTPAMDHNAVIKGLETGMISPSADKDLSYHRVSFDSDDGDDHDDDDDDEDNDDVQQYLTKDRNTEDDSEYMEDAGQAEYNSDSSTDDHSTSQEDTDFLSVKQEEEKNPVTLYNYSTEDPVIMEDVGGTCPVTGSMDANNPDKHEAGHTFISEVEERGFTNTSSVSYYESITEPTEKYHSIEPVQSNSAIKDDDKRSSEASDDVKANKNISEALWSAALLTDEDNLCLDEYEWDFTSEDLFKINLAEGENQEYTEEALDDLDSDVNDEQNNRDWELEKTRIEAFYRFYGEQAEVDDDEGRNHKVTFQLDHESSENDEDSDRPCSSSPSTEEELDSDPGKPDLNTLETEILGIDYLDNYPKTSRTQPMEQQPVSAAVKQHPHRNKCLAVIKSIIAFGLLTAIGIISFLWATENLDWIH